MDLFNWISESFQTIGDKIVSFLPSSPIVYLESIPEVEKYLGMVNWFIPIYSMISLTEAWLLAVALYYIVQIVLRWIKAIE